MKFKSLIASLSFLGFLILPSYANAQVPLFKDVCNNSGNQSSVCKDANPQANQNPNEDPDPATNPLYGPNGIITLAVNILSIVVGIAAVLGIIAAGVKYLTSGSNPQEANTARELVIYAIVGLILAAAAQFLVRVVLQSII